VAIGASEPPVVAGDDPGAGLVTGRRGGGVGAEAMATGDSESRVLCYGLRERWGIGGNLAAVAGGWCCVVFAVLRSPSTGKKMCCCLPVSVVAWLGCHNVLGTCHVVSSLVL